MSHPAPPGGWSDPSWSPDPKAETPDPTYQFGAQPVSGQPGQPGVDPAGQLPYGVPGGYPPPGYAYGYPMAPPTPTNGLSIAAMVVSIVAVTGLCAYGIGGYLGIIGAILGHMSRRQLRDREREGRPEAGAGMALAGVVLGWICTAIAVLATVAIVALIVFAVNQEPDYAY